MSESTIITFPWCPDLVQAYKFGPCELCKKEKDKDPSFDNSTCPHCKKLGRVFYWTSGRGIGNEQ